VIPAGRGAGPLADRAYRTFLLAFAPDTRRVWGDEMVRLFEDERRGVSGRPMAAARLWLRALGDALRHGLADRLGRRIPVSAHAGMAGSRRQTPSSSQPARQRRTPGVPMIQHALAVLRWSYRSLRATPLVSTLAILSLALGIGANTALFSIVNGLLLKPLPVRSPEALLLLEGGSWTYPIWEEIRRSQHELFDGAFAWAAERFDQAEGGESEFVDGAYASGEMFDVLGVRAVRGRLLTTADDVHGGGPEGPVAVISHRFWQGRFAGAADVIGRTVSLRRVSFTIVGVVPAGFTGPDVGRVADVYVPFGAEPLVRGASSQLAGRSTWWLNVMVRTRPDQTSDQANAALRAIQPRIREATMPPSYPAAMKTRYLNEAFRLVPAATGRSPLSDRAPLFAMLAVVGLVLLIACANIANLLIARALARRRELGVRLALGASRGQLAALLVGESLLLTLAGAGLGLLAAQWGGPLLVSQLNSWRQTLTLDLSPDGRILAFTAVVSLATALMAGVAPAWSVRHMSPGEALGPAGRGVVGGSGTGARGLLVAIQIALSLVLVVAAGLFLRTFAALAEAPLGFSASSLLVADLDFEQSARTPKERPIVLARMRDAAAAVPGVTSAAVAFVMPTSGRGWNSVVGTDPVPDRSRMTWMNAVSPGWFRTYGTPILAGRDFVAGDARGAEDVAIVNEAFARRFIQGPPVGQTVQIGGPGGAYTTYRVVALAGDAVYRSPREGMTPTMYVPLSQRETGFQGAALTVAVAPGTQLTVGRELAAAIRTVDRDVSFTFRTFDELVEASVTRERLVAMLSGFFGALALLLAGIGLYGVVSHTVSQRRTEIGVRIALGARPAGIVRLMARRFGGVVLAGLAAGVALSLWAGQFVQALLFQLEASDRWTLGGAVLVLSLVAALAAYLPARRAARLDPATVLREG
jgi:predicted permease